MSAGDFVWVANDLRRPVGKVIYHEWSKATHEEFDGHVRWVSRTLCGMIASVEPVYESWPKPEWSIIRWPQGQVAVVPGRSDMTFMRRDHAETLGRRCVMCDGRLDG